MKAFTTVLSVAEIHAARAFYEDLFGLELYQDYGRNLTFTCGLSLQQDFHWLTGLSRAQIHPQPNNMELAFETEDLDGFLQKLRAYPHLQTLGGVVEHPWGQRVIRFYDLDGHLIEVGESMKLVIRRFQAAGMTPEEIARKMDVSQRPGHPAQCSLSAIFWARSPSVSAPRPPLPPTPGFPYSAQKTLQNRLTSLLGML